MSLDSGKFVLLDSYTVRGAAKRQIGELTHGGRDIEAILNVHPFHTVHVHHVHELFPHATLYGTARHRSLFPELPWADICTEDPALHRASMTIHSDDTLMYLQLPALMRFFGVGDTVSLHPTLAKALEKVSNTLKSLERKYG